MVRHCRELREFVGRFGELETWIQLYKQDLDTLVQDHELLVGRKGQLPRRLRFAVDFSEVYMFAFPFSALLQNYEQAVKDPAYLRKLALEYLARACLFRKTWDVGPLTLLRPYRHELNHTLLTLLPRKVDATRLKDLSSRLSLELAEPLREAHAMATESESHSADKHAQLGSVVSLLCEHYTDLTLLLLADAGDSVSRLREIVGRKVVPPDAGSLYQKAAPSPTLVQWWYGRLLRRRGGDRERQSLRDAEALAIVEDANRLASANGHAELFLLVTSTEAVLDVVGLAGEEKRVRLPEGRSTPLVRSLRLFLVYLKHLHGVELDPMGRPKSPEQANMAILESLRAALARAEEALRLAGTSTTVLSRCPCRPGPDGDGMPRDECPLRAVEPRIETSLDDIESTREELENAQLILKNHPDLEERYAVTLAASDLSQFDQLLRHVLERVLHGKGMRDAVDVRIRALTDQLMDGLLGMNAQLVPYVQEMDAERMTGVLEFPFYARVRSEPLKSNLQHTAAEIEEAAVSGDLERVSDALRTLVGSMKTIPPPPIEKRLVELLVLLAVGEARLVKRLVSPVRDAPDKDTAANFSYLRIRAALSLGQHEVPELLRAALESHPDDGRFLLLRGVLFWQEYMRTGRQDLAVLEQALAMTDRGIALTETHVEEQTLLCDLLNNRAYYLAQIGQEAADEALRVVKRLEGLRDVDTWRGSWLDTYGYVQLRRAQSAGNDARQALAKDALRFFEKALTRFLSTAGRSAVQAHVDEASGLILLGGSHGQETPGPDPIS